jgi:hypothetical protein
VITAETRSRIKGYLEGFLDGIVQTFASSGLDPRALRPQKDKSPKGELKPFHEAIIPEGILRIAEFERSFSTRLGTSFEEVARLIGEKTHAVALRGYHVAGNVSLQEISKIEAIINTAGKRNGIPATFTALVAEVLSVGGDQTEPRSSIADLYIKTHSGDEHFFEIKSPKPNKGQCLEATSRLLQIHAINHKNRPRVNAYYAMGYNPYGSRADYKHSFAKNYMDLESQVLLAEEFWAIVGGDETYREVLSIYREVGRERGPDMLDKLALSY